MNKSDRQQITRNLCRLQETVHLSGEFCQKLQEKGLIRSDELDKLCTDSEPHRERCRWFLLQVTRRGPQAFSSLVRCLLETGQLQAARALRPHVSLDDLSCRVQPAGELSVRRHRTRAPPAHLTVRPSCVHRGEPEAYTMQSSPRGLMLVINNINFSYESGWSSRTGAHIDDQKLERVFSQLDYHVTTLRDLTSGQMRDSVEKFVSDARLKTVDSCVLFILTHGEDRVLFGVDSKFVTCESLISMFSYDTCPYMIGKPKWIVFQACRGSEVNFSVPYKPAPRLSAATVSQQCQHDGKQCSSTMYLGEQSDIFVTYSTIPGYVSIRDKECGTWLITLLCEVICEEAHRCDLYEIHTLVQDRMALKTNSFHEKQTMEVIQRGFRRRMYFNVQPAIK